MTLIPFTIRARGASIRCSMKQHTLNHAKILNFCREEILLQCGRPATDNFFVFALCIFVSSVRVQCICVALNRSTLPHVHRPFSAYHRVSVTLKPLS